MKAEIQVVRAVRHTLKDAEKHASPEGIALAKERRPVILGPLGDEFPTYVGPLDRCTETAKKGLGIHEVVKEDHFDIPTFAEEVIKANMEKIKAVAEAKGCTGIAALLEMRSIPAIHEMLSILSERVRHGVEKVCEENADNDWILVISHSPTVDAGVDDYATGGLNELDWVDYYVRNGNIFHTVVCRHVPD